MKEEGKLDRIVIIVALPNDTPGIRKHRSTLISWTLSYRIISTKCFTQGNLGKKISPPLKEKAQFFTLRFHAEKGNG